jgi:hypothetical protein
MKGRTALQLKRQDACLFLYIYKIHKHGVRSTCAPKWGALAK